MNVEMLERVKDYILEEPRRLNMGNWLRDANEIVDFEEDMPPCGTVGCIAGNACIIAGKAEKVLRNDRMIYLLPKEGPGIAQTVLDLTHEEACRLFLIDADWGDDPFEGIDGHWPPQFSSKYNAALSAQDRAKVAAERINHFIATNGAE